jgi:hypothetical protein
MKNAQSVNDANGCELFFALHMAASPVISLAEEQRQRELVKQLEREKRKKARQKSWEEFRFQLGGGTRRTLARLLGLVILLYIVINHTELNNAAYRYCQYLAAQNSKSAIRQSALKYEKEVENIVSGFYASNP